MHFSPEIFQLLRVWPCQQDARSGVDPAQHAARLTRWILDLVPLVDDKDIPWPPWGRKALIKQLRVYDHEVHTSAHHRQDPTLSRSMLATFSGGWCWESQAPNGVASSSLGLSSSRQARLAGGHPWHLGSKQLSRWIAWHLVLLFRLRDCEALASVKPAVPEIFASQSVKTSFKVGSCLRSKRSW